MCYDAHATSIISPTAVIADSVRIRPFCHILPGAEIGPETTLGQNCVVHHYVKIGARVKIQNNVSVFQGVTVEDDVFIGPSVVFTNVMYPRAFNPVRKCDYRPTLLKRGCSIGANSTILCGVTIGEYAMIGAGSVVTRSVLSHELWYGNPARCHGMVDKGAFNVDDFYGGEDEKLSG